MNRVNFSITTVILILFLCAGPVRAQIISIPNSSFESPNALGSNSPFNYTNSIDDFTASGTGSDGTQYMDSSLFSTLPDGNQFGFLNVGDIGRAETIVTSSPLAVINASLTYHLSIEVGNRLDGSYASNGTYTLNFYDNGVSVASASLLGSTITPGTFANLNLDYTPPSNDGQNITVGVTFAETSGGGFAQGDVDQFALTTSVAVPEPSTWAMMLGGLGLLLGVQRYRRAALVG